MIKITKKDANCEDSTINKKVDEVEQPLGLLDTFAYLNIHYPNEVEKSRQRKPLLHCQLIGGKLA
jgi:hypothetical protein